MLVATFRARGELPCRNCKAWFNHNFYSFMCREMKLLGVFFQLVPRGMAEPGRTFPLWFSEPALQQPLWDQAGNLVRIFPSLCSWLFLCHVWFFPNPLQMHNWLLIYYSKVAQGCGVIIVRVICSGAPPRIASVCGSLCQRLPGTGMDGNIKQQGKKQHIRAAAVYWRHAESSQVHRPQFHKYGSITQSSLVSGLQARLCRICQQVYLHPVLNVDTVWYFSPSSSEKWPHRWSVEAA